MNIVLFSGGRDSGLVLKMIKYTEKVVTAVTFDYGQIAQGEIKAARNICELWHIEHYVYKIAAFTDEELLRPENINNRNLLLISICFNIAISRHIRTIYTGIVSAVSPKLPDCQPLFVSSLQNTLNLSTNQNIKIKSPLIDYSEKNIVDFLHIYSCYDDLKQFSYSCLSDPECKRCPKCAWKM